VVVFPNCKINLGLHILQKRPDGFHDLETVFYPLPLHDALEAVQNNLSSSTDIEFHCSGIALKTLHEDNSCVKAYRLLRKDFPALPAVTMHLHKSIPSGAGLGGGSADSAFTLLLLNKKFNLELNQPKLIKYALQLGSDCPFFILNKPCFATGRGENLEQINIDLSSYSFVLVNPKIHINTAWAFSQLNITPKQSSLRDAINFPVREWSKRVTNDFEDIVFSNYKEVGEIKTRLYEQGAIYASMTGTGSTVYGLFEKNTLPQFNFPHHYFVKFI